MARKAFLIISVVAAAILYTGCSNKQERRPVLTSADITKVIDQMTIIMIHDVTNPPLAARFFSYSCLAGYEVIAGNEKGVNSMYGVLNEYPQIKKPADVSGYDNNLSALIAM